MIRSRWFSRFAFAFALACASCGDDTVGSDAPEDDGGNSYVDSGTDALCGNGRVEGTEMCDGSDLHSETCESATNGVMAGGVLRCSNGCTFDVDDCIGGDAGEDEDGGGMGGTGG